MASATRTRQKIVMKTAHALSVCQRRVRGAGLGLGLHWDIAVGSGVIEHEVGERCDDDGEEGEVRDPEGDQDPFCPGLVFVHDFRLT